MSAIRITSANFEEVTKGKKVLVDFYADWCGPCRMMSPVIDEIAQEREDIVVGKVNVDEEQELAAHFGVFSIPMLAVLEDGEAVATSVGAKPKAAVLAMLDKA